MCQFFSVVPPSVLEQGNFDSTEPALWIESAASHVFVDTLDRSLTTPALLSATQSVTVPPRIVTSAPSEAYMKAPFPMDRHPVNCPPSTTVSLSAAASGGDVSDEDTSRARIPYARAYQNLRDKAGKKHTSVEWAIDRTMQSNGGTRLEVMGRV